MNHLEPTRLDTFQRIAGVLCVVAFLASIGATLFDSEEKSLLVAGGLILTTILFTAYMIARSINYRRTLNSLSEIFSQLPDLADESKSESQDGGPSR
jgi:hypothetical protein